MFSLEDILNIAVQLESNGERVYRGAAEKSTQAPLCSFMAWMADQEAAHARWFKQLKGRAGKIAGDLALMNMGKNLLENAVGTQSFSLNALDLNRIETLQELIEVSIEFEKDTVLFYEMLAAFVKDKEGQALLAKIIDEEQCHVLMLQEFLGD